MSQSPVPQPSRRDVLRPLEMVGGAAIAAVFLGLVVLMVTREPVLAAIGAGAVFIIVLVVLAMFAITLKPDETENADIAEQNQGAADAAGSTPGPLGETGTDGETPGTRGH
ncbi:hypothetical protein [Leifsonia sp. Leaf264]|uniref:hypothetical protein n=1 Tax=Leifsonia sp. Leaf264 TaxID=1736314 RepID=UPI000AE1948C|nr:hypothetical protein [Leifsonia sp. Leaf264]